jgi:hypothetical protein
VFFARVASGYLLRFADLADFCVSDNGSEITCAPAPGTPGETIRHLLLDQVMPLALSHRGEFVLHAGAVATPAGAVAFLGHTGQGKSTLSASLVLEGGELLSDDCLVLRERGEEILAVPSYPGLRLWPAMAAELFDGSGVGPVAHYTLKQRISGQNGRLRYRAECVPLRRLYVLEEPRGGRRRRGDGVEITRLPLPAAFAQLLPCVFRLDITDSRRLREEFAGLARLARRMAVCRLAFPRQLTSLPAVRAAIRADLGLETSLSDAPRRP